MSRWVASLALGLLAPIVASAEGRVSLVVTIPVTAEDCEAQAPALALLLGNTHGQALTVECVAESTEPAAPPSAPVELSPTEPTPAAVTLEPVPASYDAVISLMVPTLAPLCFERAKLAAELFGGAAYAECIPARVAKLPPSLPEPPRSQPEPR